MKVWKAASMSACVLVHASKLTGAGAVTVSGVGAVTVKVDVALTVWHLSAAVKVTVTDPPVHITGAVAWLSVVGGLHPPAAVPAFMKVWKAASMSACVLVHASKVTGAGAVTVSGVGAVTVKVDVAVTVWHLSAAVKVTVTDPPVHITGAVAWLAVTVGVHPPAAVPAFMKVWKAASMSACVLVHASKVTGAGAVTVSGVGAVTVKVDVAVTVWHLSAAVKVTVTDPPVHITGAVAWLAVTVGVHPPAAVPACKKVWKAASMAACVLVHASKVTGAGAVTVSGVGAVTVKVDVAATVWHLSAAVKVTVTDPPVHITGAVAWLAVTVGVHPPAAVPACKKVWKAASMAACVLVHASKVTGAGAVTVSGVGAVTVKVDVAVTVWHLSAAVKVTVTDPPVHITGAVAWLAVTVGVHPPAAVPACKKVWKAASMAACVLVHASKVTGAGAVTVKVDVAVTVWHLSAAVKVTVTDPPVYITGAVAWLAVTVGVHPPAAVPAFMKVWKAASMSACVLVHASKLTGAGAVTVSGVGAVTAKVDVALTVWHLSAAVKVTVTEPPVHITGAVAWLAVTVGVHPPAAVPAFMKVWKAASMSACVLVHASKVTGAGAVTVSGVGAVTVKVDVAVTVWHLSAAVKVTVTDPPVHIT